MSTVALIPARGGSKRIERKNMQMVGANTLVARAILCAKQVRRIRDIYVSTDDQDIADEARAFGAEVIDRPADLAQDETMMEDVVQHFIKVAAIPDSAVIVLLEPSAPFRQPIDIEAVIGYLEKRSDAYAVRTLTRVADPEYHLHVVGSRGFMDPLTPIAYKSTHRPVIYRDNGLVNAFRVGRFLDTGMLFTDDVLGMEISDPSRGIDIDTPDELALAQMAASDIDRNA